MQETLCSALDSLIEECTVILGWCYSAAEVEDTKRRQRSLMAEAMEAADFDSAHCPAAVTAHDDDGAGGGKSKISEPLTATAAAAAAAGGTNAAFLAVAAIILLNVLQLR